MCPRSASVSAMCVDRMLEGSVPELRASTQMVHRSGKISSDGEQHAAASRDTIASVDVAIVACTRSIGAVCSTAMGPVLLSNGSNL